MKAEGELCESCSNGGALSNGALACCVIKKLYCMLASCVKLAQWQVVWRLFGSFPSHLAVGLLQWLHLDTVNFITARNTKESIFKLVFYSSYDTELL